MVKVSVIIPVYNVELYLKETLESIINQSLKEIEIIVINDGSTDKSLDIIKKYQNMDKRIKIINQKNKGVSVSRNEGLKKATGEYIYFMDGDDYLEKIALEKCYVESVNQNLDVLFFDGESFLEKLDNIIGNYYTRNNVSKNVKNGKGCLKELNKLKYFRTSPCLNFINKKYLDTLKLKFYPKIIHEDELFTYILYLNAKNIKYLNEKFFKRRIRENSIMTNEKTERNIVGYLTVAKEFEELIKKEKDLEKKQLLSERNQVVIGSAISVLEFLDNDLKNRYKLYIKENYSKELILKNKIKLEMPKLFKITKKIKEIKYE
ncbi:glycosyltransferase [Cetobacterium somerae]|uniref:glycosyltransferase family 2 protein n=1 Tax=Cetobacterium somerae TaxID=188913 RepID=UPI00211EC51D|nr:glycosyltransferase [Cetobacterium somerae]MCQ9628389.1 glycosyltransferase [Cetobacterium somerae]